MVSLGDIQRAVQVWSLKYRQPANLEKELQLIIAGQRARVKPI
jgi:hypothetical protein